MHRGVEVWDDVPGALSGPLLDLICGDGASARTLVTASSGTPFQERVWAALRLVPRGAVLTYADLAASIGMPRGMRAVGAAMARNPLPLVVPCHRVIAAGGRLGGFSAGLEMKRLLLELEGVHVEGGRVGPVRAHGSTRPTRS
jgi:O-6-methylguanine DNA methyltransferase